MLHSISLSHFYPNNYETAVVGPIITTALIENTNEQVPCGLTICLEGRCSVQGYLDLKEGRRECRVEFQFPLLFKNRLEKIFKKGNFVAKAVVSPGPSETTILKLFSDKLVKDAEVYVSYLNVDSNTTALSIYNEADCVLENSELMQPFLLFLLKCSIPNQAPQELFLRPIYSMIQNSPHASRNAIAILSRIGYSFFRENLEGINISGAHLEGTLLYNAKLDNAKMTGAYIKDACFHNASLINAKMDGIDTGRKPSLIHDSEISNWSISPDERHVAVCTKDGEVCFWDLKKFTLHKKTPLLRKLSPFQFSSIDCAYPIDTDFNQPIYPIKKQRLGIILVKFINDTQLILLTTLRTVILWSLTLSKILDEMPTVISYAHNPQRLERPLYLYENLRKGLDDFFKYSKFQIKNILCTNKPNSNGFLPLILCYSLEDTLKNPRETIKSVCEIWGVTDNAIIPLKKENFLEMVLHAGLPFRLSTKFKSQTTVLTSTQNSQVCLSPSGWIACLVTENPGSSLTLMQTPHIDRSAKFLIPNRTHWCNFSNDDLWLIGVTIINHKNCVVKWRTTQLYSTQSAAIPIMEIPRPDTLFTTKDVIERCDLVPDSPNCVYSTNSTIYVRDLSNHDIIYQVGIPELNDFKIISKKNLLLTNRDKSSILEARQVNTLVNASVQTAHTSLRVEYFTRDSQALMMLPRNLTLLQWIMQTDDIRQASQNLLSSNLSNLKTYLNFRNHNEDSKEFCLFSPRFEYMVLINSHKKQICIWNIAEDKLHCNFKIENLDIFLTFEKFLKEISNIKYVMPCDYDFLESFYLTHQFLIVALSDEPSLAITSHDGQIVIYNLCDPNNIKNYYIFKTKKEICNIHLSKCNMFANIIFTSSNHTIFQYNYISNEILIKFRNCETILSFDVSYDNRFLVSSDDKSIRLWDIRTGNELDKQDTSFFLTLNLLLTIALLPPLVKKRKSLIYGKCKSLNCN